MNSDYNPNSVSDDPAAGVQELTAPPRPADTRLRVLPQLLRLTGSIVLMLAAAVFMLQEWAGMSHQTKYFSFLGFTLLLSGCGLMCGVTLNEAKGARTFLALSAAVVPVHFCQLGGFLYSCLIDSRILQLPQYALWVAGSWTSALVTTAIGIMALAPVTVLAFRVLARERAGELTLIYLLLNSLILIPSRDPMLTALLAGGLTLVMMHFDAAVLRAGSAMRTKEGVFVRCMLIAPLLILPLRTVLLYHPDRLFVAMICAALAVALFAITPLYPIRPQKVRTLQGLSVFPMMTAWMIFSRHFCLELEVIPPSKVVLAAGLPISFTLATMAYYARGSSRSYLGFAVFTALATVFAQIVLFPDFVSAFVVLVVGITTLIYAYLFDELPFVFLGAGAIVTGLGYVLHYALQYTDFSPWISLAVLGVVTILSSSIIERTLPRLKTSLEDFKCQISREESRTEAAVKP